MRTITINNVKYIKSLNQTKNRKKFGEFFIEGKRLIESSILYNADIKNIYLTEKFINDNIFFKKLILKNEIKITKVSSKDFQKISNTENPSGENYNQVKFPTKYILVLGNESHGFKKEILNIFDTTISIKKTGYGESLNVSAAGSILMNYLSEK